MPEISSEGTAEAAPSSRSSEVWKERIIIPTLLAGIVGGGVGLVSKHGKTLGVGAAAASYASNFAIVAGGYCGARELARDARASEPDDLMNSVVGGFASGAVLGRLQGGQAGAIKYSILFAAVGTTVDYTTMRLRPYFESMMNTLSSIKDRSWSIPEWSPIQVLDEEALEAKREREQLHAQRSFGKLSKEEQP